MSVGDNNINEPDEITTAIKLITAQIQAKIPNARIIILPITPRGTKSDFLWNRIQKTNAGMAKIADGKTVIFIDIAERLEGTEDGRRPGAFEYNSYRLTPEGYAVISEALSPEVR